MATYKFKLIESKVPEVRGKKIVTDSNVGGTKNLYKIYLTNRKFFFLKLPDVFIGTKAFLRPYQSVWPKGKYRMNPSYWGKGPMLNIWIVLSRDYYEWSDRSAVLVDDDTTKHITTVLNVEFESQELTKNLKSNKSFYQSNIKSYERQF